MKMTLSEIKHKVDQLAAKINAPAHYLPTFSSPIGDATPNIEVDDFGLYHYVISERGNEYDRKMTSDLDDLLYWIFSSVTFSVAADYELKNRIEDQDFRRILFRKQRELLRSLNEEWEERERKEHEYILFNNPFDDIAGLRAKGLSESEIDKLANEKIPEK